MLVSVIRQRLTVLIGSRLRWILTGRLTLLLYSNTLGTGADRVFLDFGHDTGLFEIDNVSLVAGHVGTEALNLPADDNSSGGDTPTDLVANMCI